MIVRVKKVERRINWGAKDPKTGKIKSMYENCKDEFVPGINKVSGALRTGITTKEANAFEVALGLEVGTLAPASPYWIRFKIAIPEDGLLLNTDNALDELSWKIMKACPTVAESFLEAKTNAKAEYYLTSDNAEAKVSNTKRNAMAQAYAAFAKLSQAETIDALYMFGKDPSQVDFEVAQNTLGELLDENPHSFLQRVGDKDFKDKVWFHKLINAGVVKKHGAGTGTDMPLYFADILLGTGLEEAIAFTKDKKNQTTALGMKKTYEAYIKG